VGYLKTIRSLEVFSFLVVVETTCTLDIRLDFSHSGAHLSKSCAHYVRGQRVVSTAYAFKKLYTQLLDSLVVKMQFPKTFHKRLTHVCLHFEHPVQTAAQLVPVKAGNKITLNFGRRLVVQIERGKPLKQGICLYLHQHVVHEVFVPHLFGLVWVHQLLFVLEILVKAQFVVIIDIVDADFKNT